MNALSLTSSAFEDGEPLPKRCGYTRTNVNPHLSIQGVPENTRALALIMDDPDAVEPAGKIWDHWLIWNISPDRDTIPEDFSPDVPVEGTNDYGELGYGGPNPPDREHTYRFQLYALDSPLELASGADRNALEEAIQDRVLSDTVLRGTFAPEDT